MLLINKSAYEMNMNYTTSTTTWGSTTMSAGSLACKFNKYKFPMTSSKHNVVLPQ